MNFKPFYVKTENLDSIDVESLWELAVSNGARWYSTDSCKALDYEYFGVDDSNETECRDMEDGGEFGVRAVELTYEEALLHVQGKLARVQIPAKSAEGVHEHTAKDSDLLVQAATELSNYIGKVNSTLESKVNGYDLDPPEYHDYQTCQELIELAAKLRARGE